MLATLHLHKLQLPTACLSQRQAAEAKEKMETKCNRFKQEIRAMQLPTKL